MKIKIKYHGVAPIEKTDKGDWIDLRSADDVKILRGEFKMISLGVSMELPKGYEAIVVPRSSTYKNFGIRMTNGMGVIDETYCGDNDVWKFPAYADRDTHINKGDRIAQFRIFKHQPMFDIEEVESLGNEDRNGFGSSGIK